MSKKRSYQQISLPFARRDESTVEYETKHKNGVCPSQEGMNPYLIYLQIVVLRLPFARRDESTALQTIQHI